MSRTLRDVALLLSALLLVALAGCAGDSKQSSTGELVDDSVITTKVKAAFLAEEKLKVLQISVQTFRGTVQLSGFVESRAMADRAVRVARNVSGVKAVRDDMRVR
ncbi:MAG: BON domain-containing protein [Proteobacteria bacterium]|nr:BON domain-containing protein [Pseudomonadota bacterium]